MNRNKIIFALATILLALSLYNYFGKSTTSIPKVETPAAISTTTAISSTTKNVSYVNQKYGFSFELPESWKDYTTTENEIEFGTAVTIRKSNWTESAPTAEIPILIYPTAQWEIWQTNNFENYPTAAPIGPTKRGSNENYVFATAPRYNFSFLPGFEEVETIVSEIKSFDI